MVTVPEAARRLDQNPETIRRWIRAGKPLPPGLDKLDDGSPMPNIVAWVWESRRGH
jgi:transposase-like protein